MSRLPPIRTFVAAVVTMVWAIVYLASLVDSSVHPPPELSTVMGFVVIYLVASDARQIRKNGNGNGS